MNLLMIGGDRAVLRGRKGAYWNTLRHLRQHWNRIDVICPQAPVKGQQTINFDEPGGQVVFHPNPRGLWSQAGWIKKRGDELLKERDYGVITAHLFPPFYASAGASKLDRGATALVLELHGLPGVPAAQGFKERVGSLMARRHIPRVAKLADGVRVVSPTLRATLEGWGIPGDRIQLIPAIYLDAAIYEALPESPRPVDVVFCGRLDDNKGIMTILGAVAELRGCTMTVIGDGPLLEQCQRFVDKNSLTERVRFTGWIADAEEIARHLSSAKILCMNSRYEGGPRVVFEAMACGTVPIATRVGIAQNVLEDSKNGLFTTGEKEDLKAKISALLADPEKLQEMSEAARLVLETYDRRKSLQAYNDFLQQTAKRS